MTPDDRLRALRDDLRRQGTEDALAAADSLDARLAAPSAEEQRDLFAREIVAAEWAATKGFYDDPCCPFCWADRDAAHHPDCIILRAKEVANGAAE